MPNGNWVIGEMEDAPKADGFEWGFTALPAVKEGGERASYTFFEQIWMPAEAKEQDLGKEFIAYLYSDEAAKIFFDKGGAVQPIEGMSDMITDDNTKCITQSTTQAQLQLWMHRSNRADRRSYNTFYIL